MISTTSVLTLSDRGISLGIFVGFASFFMMEKTLRVLGSEGGGHSHSHSHSHSVEGSTSHSSGVEISHGDGELKVRKMEMERKEEQEKEKERSSQNGPSKLSAYLNLFGDFVHNMCVPYFFRRLPLSCGSFERFSTDGLAYVRFTPSF
jgi:zinc transporter 7